MSKIKAQIEYNRYVWERTGLTHYTVYNTGERTVNVSMMGFEEGSYVDSRGFMSTSPFSYSNNLYEVFKIMGETVWSL